MTSSGGSTTIMGTLNAAVAAGYREAPDRIRDIADLAALRDRSDFVLLLMDLALPAEVFARGE